MLKAYEYRIYPTQEQEATEITNACGEPRSSMKQESEQTSLVF